MRVYVRCACSIETTHNGDLKCLPRDFFFLFFFRAGTIRDFSHRRDLATSIHEYIIIILPPLVSAVGLSLSRCPRSLRNRDRAVDV